MDDLVTRAFLILVCIMCAHQSGCVRLCNDSDWCAYARVNHLCLRMFWKDLAKQFADGSWQTWKCSICLLIPVFFLLLNIKMKVFFFFFSIFIFILNSLESGELPGQKAIHPTSRCYSTAQGLQDNTENYISFRSVSCWLRPLLLRWCVFKCLFFCRAWSLQLRRLHHRPSVADLIFVIF